LHAQDQLYPDYYDYVSYSKKYGKTDMYKKVGTCKMEQHF